MPPRPLTFFGLRLWPVAGTLAAVAIAVAGLTWLERNSQAPRLQPAADRPPAPTAQPNLTQPKPAQTQLAQLKPVQPTPAQPTAQATANPLPSGTGAATYWVDDRNNRVAFSRQAIGQSKTTSTDPEAQLRQAMESLLSGNGQTSSIPSGTRLRSLTIRDRRNIYIDLSQEFITGGGTASMSARVGQVLLTATSIDPNAQIWLMVEGELLRELGGEGIEIPQPLTKEAFEKNFGL